MLCLVEREGDTVVTAQIKVREIKHEKDNNRSTPYGRSYVVYTNRVFYNDMDVDDYMGISSIQGEWEEFIFFLFAIFVVLAIWGI